MNRTWNRVFAVGMCLGLAACGGTASDPENPGTTSAGTCTLAANTAETSTVSPSGCHVLTRDTSACEAERKAQGLSGYWLQFSCRVSLSSTTTNGVKMVRAQAGGQPDYKSFFRYAFTGQAIRWSTNWGGAAEQAQHHGPAIGQFMILR